MSLKSLADNLKSEDEFHTFVKSEISDTKNIIFTTFFTRNVRHHSLSQT